VSLFIMPLPTRRLHTRSLLRMLRLALRWLRTVACIMFPPNISRISGHKTLLALASA
jgi:hypothetical protein